MSTEVVSVDLREIRGMDNNSLLRLYDRAKEAFNTAQWQQERARADRVIKRVAQELKKRNVLL